MTSQAMETRGCTPRQQQILAFIEEYYQRHRLSPTLREVQKALGLASVSTVAQHVRLLRERGLLPAEGGRRSLIPPPAEPTSCEGAADIPFLGFFSPTSGIETLAIPKTFSVPKSLLVIGVSCYAIQMRGDDLLEEGILDGDLLIVAVGTQPKPGQGALIRDGKEWWLRRVELAGDYLCLESLTQRSAPVFRAAEQIEVFAVLLALWRHYEPSLFS